MRPVFVEKLQANMDQNSKRLEKKVQFDADQRE